MTERIGILKLGSLGDIVHTLPALAALRRHYPKAYIGWVVEAPNRGFLEGHPLLDEVFPIDTARWRRLRFGGALPALRRIRRARFDVVIDFQGLLKSALLGRWTGARERIGFEAACCREPFSAHLSTVQVRPRHGARHVVELNLALLSPLVPHPQEEVVEFPLGLTAAEGRQAEAYFARLGWGPETPVLALHPGAGWATKQWDTSRYAALGERLVRETGARLLLTWGPGDEARVEALRGTLRAPAELLPPTSVRELAAILGRCQLFIGGDTGPLHLAAAQRVPTVALFGPTTPERNGPYGPLGRVVHHELPCSHCYKGVCPGYGTRCLTSMTVEEVAEVALEQWALSASSGRW
jgi:lipopolysaccharide heptosyltransferase I